MGQVVEDRYLIEAALGRGAMGMVYRARHTVLGREVAIKVLHGHLLGDRTMVARFEREAAAAAKLHHHNLVNVIDVGETSTRQKLMVLELARGQCLASMVGLVPMEATRVVHLAKQLLHGLAHAHAAGLVHRDLKPENVVVELAEDGTEVAKIVDFGIAVLRGHDDALADVRLTDSGMVMGTPHYMAPEQAKGQPADPRTDLFALGVMMYEMLAGKLPFDGNGMDAILASVHKDPPPIAERSLGVTVDPLLEAFVRKLMARRIFARFRDAHAALDMLALIERDPEAAATALGLAVHKALALVSLPPMSAEPAPPSSFWQRVRKYFRK